MTAVPTCSGGLPHDWLQYGLAQRPSRKDEDRFIATAHAPWGDYLAAVLDGHNGRRAAETCAARLVQVVSEELARLEEQRGAASRVGDDSTDASSANWHPQVCAPLGGGGKNPQGDLSALAAAGPGPPRLAPALAPQCGTPPSRGARPECSTGCYTPPGLSRLPAGPP
jgi:hypothetical protein